MSEPAAERWSRIVALLLDADERADNDDADEQDARDADEAQA